MCWARGTRPLIAVVLGTQATESQDVGISPQDHKAMCAGRQHSPATCERFYERRSLKRFALDAIRCFAAC